MKSKTSVLFLVGSVALAGCDTVVRIKGEAPQSTTCLVHVVDKERGRIAKSVEVSGTFEEKVVLPGARLIAITAECGGRQVRTVIHPVLPDVNLGKLGL